jgi:hypothetical protein
MFIPDPLGNLGKIITKGMGKLKALSKPLREKIGGTFGKSNKPNRSGNKADFDPNKHKLNKAQLQKLNDDLADNKALKDAMDGRPELVDAWKPIAEAGHDARKNVDLLKKIDTDDFDANKVGDYLKNQKAPASFEGKVNYSVTKNNVTVDYDANGFPKFEKHSPGEGYLYQPGNDNPLIGAKTSSGSNTDIKNANKAMSKEFQGNTSNQFKWDGKSNNFEIIDSNGNSTKYTWHHYQDGKSMFPVPSKIHNTREGGFKHSGGSTIIRDGLEGLFDPPNFQ